MPHPLPICGADETRRNGRWSQHRLMLSTECASVDMLRLSFSLAEMVGSGGLQRAWVGWKRYVSSAECCESDRDGTGWDGGRGTEGCGTYTLGKAPWTALDVCALQLLWCCSSHSGESVFL